MKSVGGLVTGSVMGSVTSIHHSDQMFRIIKKIHKITKKIHVERGAPKRGEGGVRRLGKIPK